jgi:hypothetical protein
MWKLKERMQEQNGELLQTNPRTDDEKKIVAAHV